MCEKPWTENTQSHALDNTKKQVNNQNKKSLWEKHRQRVTTLKEWNIKTKTTGKTKTHPLNLPKQWRLKNPKKHCAHWENKLLST